MTWENIYYAKPSVFVYYMCEDYFALLAVLLFYVADVFPKNVLPAAFFSSQV